MSLCLNSSQTSVPSTFQKLKALSPKKLVHSRMPRGLTVHLYLPACLDCADAHTASKFSNKKRHAAHITPWLASSRHTNTHTHTHTHTEYEHKETSGEVCTTESFRATLTDFPSTTFFFSPHRPNVQCAYACGIMEEKDIRINTKNIDGGPHLLGWLNKTMPNVAD